MADQQISTRSPRTTRAQRARVVKRFRRSGLSQTAFAHRHGMAVWKLSRWLADANRAAQPTSPVVFGEIKLAPPLMSTPGGWAMELVVANGLTIRCREALPLGEIVALLRD